MTTPFDTLAARYNTLWSAAPHGIQQRRRVWHQIDGLFAPGQHILDLGCGIGDDALHLQAHGLRVTGIDASQEMITIARRRGVEGRHLSIEQLSHINSVFDGALSNFGAFNCVADPSAAARNIAQLLRPNSCFAMCVLSRFYWRESLACNFRRWPGHTIWRGLNIYYRTSSQWQRAFAPLFALLRRARIGSGDHALYIWRRT